MAVHELAGTLPVSRPAVSQHLRVLKDAGLVTDRKTGTRRLYQLDPEGVARLRAHFDQVWDKALSAFQTSVASQKAPSQKGKENNAKHRRSSRRP
jgi:DNA-binding transcriptional regulator GbsR (MarR family)